VAAFTVATSAKGTSIAQPWHAVLTTDLPPEISTLFPDGVEAAIGRFAHGLQTTLWYVVRPARASWYAVGPFYRDRALGGATGRYMPKVLITQRGARRTFRTQQAAQKCVDHIENAPQPNDPRY
jgi:hypothetical protein